MHAISGRCSATLINEVLTIKLLFWCPGTPAQALCKPVTCLQNAQTSGKVAVDALTYVLGTSICIMIAHCQPPAHGEWVSHHVCAENEQEVCDWLLHHGACGPRGHCVLHIPVVIHLVFHFPCHGACKRHHECAVISLGLCVSPCCHSSLIDSGTLSKALGTPMWIFISQTRASYQGIKHGHSSSPKYPWYGLLKVSALPENAAQTIASFT